MSFNFSTFNVSFILSLLFSRHEKMAQVSRQDCGEIKVHAHRAVRGSIPLSQTFTASVVEFQHSSGAGKRTAVFRPECSMKPNHPPTHPAYPL